ncbi:Hypothetical protein SRAE_0000048400 [Strongyloides ratti]|uniref:Uncharacterized protein n=1 Tax=Strongyloides ratti TaxID=34506 RepID=A0A090MSS6_STRRB|nr:Hypothetical protein SRAE_0000048400 [Strongyloides ratti]CEF61358.1 Hypothetical protein SRAE_0000048400 [Strongyloides ratti]
MVKESIDEGFQKLDGRMNSIEKQLTDMEKKITQAQTEDPKTKRNTHILDLTDTRRVTKGKEILQKHYDLLQDIQPSTEQSIHLMSEVTTGSETTMSTNGERKLSSFYTKDLDAFNPKFQISTYISILERAMRRDHIEEEDEKVDILCLKMPPYIYERISDITDYEKMKEFLVKNYDSKITKKSAQAKLRVAKVNLKNLEESLREIGKLVEQANPELKGDSLLNQQVNDCTSRLHADDKL